MSCKQLYGPCDALIHGESSEEMMENGKKHAMEMIAKGDKVHIEAYGGDERTTCEYGSRSN